MITKFKIFEDLKLHDVQVKVENSIPPLLDLLIEELSFIYHKQKRKYRNLRIESIDGYFNKKTLKYKDQCLESNLKVILSNKDELEATVIHKSNTQEEECVFTIKINKNIVYDFTTDSDEDYNKKLVELAVREYKKYLKSKNWKIKNA